MLQMFEPWKEASDGQRRTERLVLGRGELIADEIPDEFVIPAAQDVRDDVLASHRNEHKQRAGHNAGKGEP